MGRPGSEPVHGVGSQRVLSGLQFGRRWFLSGLVAAAAWPTLGAEPIRRVLFIGNSFTLEHSVPGRVAALAEAAARPIEPHLIARPGARLAGHARRQTLQETLRWGWEAVVLQDHSLEGLFEDRARQSAAAIRLLAARAAPAAVVLAVPWSRAPGHPLYARPAAPGFAAPRSPEEMTALNSVHFRQVAASTGARLAHLAAAFDTASAQGRAVYASDRYHASPEGADLAARVIWQALAPLLP